MKYTNNNKRIMAEDNVRKAYGCVCDKVGNYPCDNGASCDYCRSTSFKDAVEHILAKKHNNMNTDSINTQEVSTMNNAINNQSNTRTIEVSNTALELSVKFTLVGDDANFIDLHSNRLIKTLQEAFDCTNSTISVNYTEATPYAMRIDFCRKAPVIILAGDTEDIYQVYVTNNTDTDKVVTALSAICTVTQFTVLAGSIEDYFKAINNQHATKHLND